MTLQNRHEIKDAAKDALAAASYDPKKIILIHTGVSLALMLTLVVLDFLLENQISETGGLSGLGLRSVLSTLQSLLQTFQLIVLPFWEIGYFYATMKLARREPVSPASLLEGFRRFGPILRIMLLKGLIYFGICIVCVYVGTQIYLLTPLSRPLAEALTPLMAQGGDLENLLLTDPTLITAVQDALTPIMLIFGALFCAAALPISYRLRMVNYAVLDAPRKGALAAMRRSFQLMRRNCISLFRLDLSFWWYYLLQLLLSFLCYGDVLLGLAGIMLPWSGTASFFLFYILFLVCQLALYYLARNQVEVAYATAYDILRSAQPGSEAYPSRQQPWTY